MPCGSRRARAGRRPQTPSPTGERSLRSWRSIAVRIGGSSSTKMMRTFLLAVLVSRSLTARQARMPAVEPIDQLGARIDAPGHAPRRPRDRAATPDGERHGSATLPDRSRGHTHPTGTHPSQATLDAPYPGLELQALAWKGSRQLPSPHGRESQWRRAMNRPRVRARSWRRRHRSTIRHIASTACSWSRGCESARRGRDRFPRGTGSLAVNHARPSATKRCPTMRP
jgi:hypothetical protein